MKGVYLLHLNRKLSDHAQHYIGYAPNIEARLDKHWAGTGAKMLKAAKLAGICWEVARIWINGDRTLERKLKNWKKARLLCPICNDRLSERDDYIVNIKAVDRKTIQCPF